MARQRSGVELTRQVGYWKRSRPIHACVRLNTYPIRWVAAGRVRVQVHEKLSRAHLMHEEWGSELPMEKSPHPRPLSHPMGEGGRQAG